MFKAGDPAVRAAGARKAVGFLGESDQLGFNAPPFEGNENLLTLLHPYALMMGLTTMALFAMHGSIYLHLKTCARTPQR